MCQGHVWLDQIDEITDWMFGRDSRMLGLLYVEALRLRALSEKRGAVAREYRQKVLEPARAATEAES